MFLVPGTRARSTGLASAGAEERQVNLPDERKMEVGSWKIRDGRQEVEELVG